MQPMQLILASLRNAMGLAFAIVYSLSIRVSCAGSIVGVPALFSHTVIVPHNALEGCRLTGII